MNASLTLRQGNLIDSTAEAILLTIDGVARGMEGNIARVFQRNYPDAWEELEDEIEYPLSLGKSVALDIHDEYDCRFKTAIIASTLNHMDILPDQQKIGVMESAFYHSLSLCQQRQINTLATALLRGGWRVSLEEALLAMLNVIKRFYSLHPSTLQVSIFVLNSSEFERLMVCLQENGISYQLTDNEVSVHLES